MDVRAHRELVQALPARVVGAHRARVERRQPHVRVPRRRPRVLVPPRVTHSRRGREPLPRVRGDHRRRLARHRARARNRRPASTATRTRPPTCNACPSSIVEAIDAFEQSKVAADAFGADVHDHLLNTAAAGVARLQPVGHRLGTPAKLRPVVTCVRWSRSRVGGWAPQEVAVRGRVRAPARVPRRGRPRRAANPSWSTPRATSCRCSTASTRSC